MNNHRYLEILETLISQRIWMNILWLILGVILWLIVFKFRKNKSKYVLILLPLIVLNAAIDIIPIALDIDQKSIFVQENVGYRRIFSNGSKRTSATAQRKIILYFSEEPGETFYIGDYYEKNNENKFPYGDYTGTVVYTKHSDLILKFEKESNALPDFVSVKSIEELENDSLDFLYLMIVPSILVFLTYLIFFRKTGDGSVS